MDILRRRTGIRIMKTRRRSVVIMRAKKVLILVMKTIRRGSGDNGKDKTNDEGGE